MMQQSLNVAYSDGSSQVLWEDGERVFSRGWRPDDNGNRLAVLLVAPAADQPSRSTLDRLTHEYELKDELDGTWAARPLALMRDAGRTVLVLDDLGGEPLERLLGGPMEVGRFLRLAIAATWAVGKLHQRGLIHKDIKPANIVVDCADAHVRLTGFGIASRLSRERQAPRAARDHRRYACLHGTRANRTDEPLGRRAQRSLRPRCHAVPDANGRSALHGGRTDGMGALPYCKKAGAARRAVKKPPRLCLCDYYEAARQDCRGALPDGCRRRERSTALPC
ncbi:hypothetical protein ACVWW3_005869 [Bradyrhizobium sp. LM2.9]